jgi:D-alanyl-D-alanine carboxypeptidase (penicillin-binding protein 5/6)
MILIAKAAINNRIIRRYAALPRDNVTYADGYTTTWINTNAMLHPDSPYYRASVIGLKTGSLDHNCCVVIGAEIRGTRYLIGIFGAEDNDARFADAAAIVDLLTNRREVAK